METVLYSVSEINLSTIDVRTLINNQYLDLSPSIRCRDRASERWQAGKEFSLFNSLVMPHHKEQSGVFFPKANPSPRVQRAPVYIYRGYPRRGCNG